MNASIAVPVECIHGLFDQRIEQMGTAEAIRWQGESVSYVSLGRRANRLAWLLLEAGVVTGDRIAPPSVPPAVPPTRP